MQSKSKYIGNKYNILRYLITEYINNNITTNFIDCIDDIIFIKKTKLSYVDYDKKSISSFRCSYIDAKLVSISNIYNYYK